MIHYHCPNCDEKLSSPRDLAGLPIRCPFCHIDIDVPRESTFEPAHVGAAHAVAGGDAPAAVHHHEAPPQWVEVPDEPSSDLTVRIAACVLFVVCSATFFTPWGWITALKIGLQKGSHYCYAPGCERTVDMQVPYGERGPDGTRASVEYVGYCEEHAARPAKDLTRYKGKNVKSLLAFVLLAGGIAYCIWYVMGLFSAVSGEKNAFRNLVVISLIGVVGLNLASYLFWIWLCPVMHF
jgi:hypothetical protein